MFLAPRHALSRPMGSRCLAGGRTKARNSPTIRQESTVCYSENSARLFALMPYTRKNIPAPSLSRQPLTARRFCLTACRPPSATRCHCPWGTSPDTTMRFKRRNALSWESLEWDGRKSSPLLFAVFLVNGCGFNGVMKARG